MKRLKTANRTSMPLAAFVAAAALLSAAPAVGQDFDALLEAEAQVEAVWEQTPLSFRKALFVTEAAAYGVYQERANSSFSPGEPIVIYAEPVGYGYVEQPDGTYVFGFDIDLLVKTGAGEIVGGQEGFAKVDFQSHSRNREFIVTLTLDLTGAPAGDYIVEYTTHDIASDKVGVISLPFSVTE